MTIALVLRAIYKLLGNVEKDYLRQHWNDTTVPGASIGHNVKEARNTYIADLTRRWVTELSTDTKRLRVIATWICATSITLSIVKESGGGQKWHCATSGSTGK